METQEINAVEPCPQGIVGQLLEIAKEHDAMSEIGGATSWRWQEGIISRMPKTKTVAKILTKAFKTDNPYTWLSKTNGDLNSFVKKNFKIKEHGFVDLGLSVETIFDSLFVLKCSSKLGCTREEIISTFCYFKYAINFQDEDVIMIPENKKLTSLYGDWAKNKLEKILDKIPYVQEGESIKLEVVGHNNSEKHTRNILELHSLQVKMVGFNSEHDFWNGYNYSLTDDENIRFELELIKFIKGFHEKISLERDKSLEYNTNALRKLRHYSFGVITLPSNQQKEGLQ